GRGQRFERGLVLREEDAGPYLDALAQTRVMPVDDANADNRTYCLRAYLQSRGIGALLDAAVRLDGAAIGIVCAEHVGKSRTWSSREQEFVFAVSQILSTRLASVAQVTAQRGQERAMLLSDAMSGLAELLDSKGAAELAV